MFAVFLDVDGVLNTKTTVQISPDGFTGIDDARVEILAKSLAKYGDGVIVITSDWKDIRGNSEDFSYLNNKLGNYGLSIYDTTTGKHRDRGAGVEKYLKSHPEIDEYIILDDTTFDFEDFPKLWERLLLTNGIENAKHASKTPAIEAMIFLDYIKMF